MAGSFQNGCPADPDERLGVGPDIRIETRRAILRRWRRRDLEAFKAMSTDLDVMTWIGGTFDSDQAEAAAFRAERRFETLGYGHFVGERKRDGLFMGIVGMVPLPERPPFPQGVSLGGRLIRQAWGFGYAFEAGEAVILDAFNRVGLAEVLAFTAPGNVRSHAIMQRMGFTRDPSRDFDHPDYGADHPLRRHEAYYVRPGWHGPSLP
jgi:RimJ/RimL family protein N-acetyltransferase